jgi:amidase
VWPAAYTGVYGLKPTHGLVPYTGIASLHLLIDHCGPVAGSIQDIAVLVSVLAVYDGIDPRMTPETPLLSKVKDYDNILDVIIEDKKNRGEWKVGTAGSDLKVGIITEAWNFPGIDEEVGHTVRAAAERFRELGATVEGVSILLHSHGPAILTAATRAIMSNHAA